MLHVNAFVKNLTEPNCDRFDDAEQTIQQWRTEVRVVNKIVRYAIDVPGNADRVNEAEDEHPPERYTREKIEHAEEIGAV